MTDCREGIMFLTSLFPSGGQGVVAPPTGQPSGGPAAVLTQQQQAEVLYQSQLEQLANMGFPDRQRNITGWAAVMLVVCGPLSLSLSPPSSDRDWGGLECSCQQAHTVAR